MTGATLLVTTGNHGILFKKRHSGYDVDEWVKKNKSTLVTLPAGQVSFEWQKKFAPDWADIGSKYAKTGFIFQVDPVRLLHAPTLKDKWNAFTREAQDQLYKLKDNLECSYTDYDFWVDLDSQIIYKWQGNQPTPL